MNADQIWTIEETLRHENGRIPVAFIADSPWISGYCGYVTANGGNNRGGAEQFPQHIVSK